MRIQQTLIVLCVGAGLSACGGVRNGGANAGAVRESAAVASVAPAKVVNPMAGFARMVGGAWEMTLKRGTRAYHTWTWGPGGHSLRRISQEQDAAPWAGDVVYWHPGLKEVRILNLHTDIPAVGRGVGEGRFKLDGDAAEGFLDLRQPGGVRKLSTRWLFDGPDRYHDTLLEDTGSGFWTLAEWDFVRVKEGPEAGSRAGAGGGRWPEYLKAFQPLVGRAWEASKSVEGDRQRVHSTFEWFPSLELIVLHVTSPGEGATTLVDAYIYHHLGTKEVRCLALSRDGGVYEGRASVLDEGVLEFDLKGYEGDVVRSYVVRLDVEQDGLVRQRVWSVDGGGRRLEVDLRHKAAE